MKPRLRITLLDLLAATLFCAIIFTAGKMSSLTAALTLVSTMGLSFVIAALSFYFRQKRIAKFSCRYSCVVLCLFMMYLVSLGPACWIMTSPTTSWARNRSVKTMFYRVFAPAGVCYASMPHPVDEIGFRFLHLWVADDVVGNHGWGVRITIDGDMSVVGI